jgi:hypothetical protein
MNHMSTEMPPPGPASRWAAGATRLRREIRNTTRHPRRGVTRHHRIAEIPAEPRRAILLRAEVAAELRTAAAEEVAWVAAVAPMPAAEAAAVVVVGAATNKPVSERCKKRKPCLRHSLNEDRVFLCRDAEFFLQERTGYSLVRGAVVQSGYRLCARNGAQKLHREACLRK